MTAWGNERERHKAPVPRRKLESALPESPNRQPTQERPWSGSVAMLQRIATFMLTAESDFC